MSGNKVNLHSQLRQRGESYDAFIRRRAQSDPTIIVPSGGRPVEGSVGTMKDFRRAEQAREVHEINTATEELQNTMRENARQWQAWARTNGLSKPDPGLECERIDRFQLVRNNNELISDAEVSEQTWKAFDQFLKELHAKHEYALQEPGKTKLHQYTLVQCANMRSMPDTRKSSTFHAIFERMVFLDMFNRSSELATFLNFGSQKKLPTADEMIAEIGPDQRQARGVLDNLVAGDIIPMFHKWTGYMQQVFGLDVFTKAQEQFIADAVRRLNLNLMLSQSYDLLRKEMNRYNVINGCITTEERLGEEVDQWVRICESDRNMRPTVRAYQHEYNKRRTEMLARGEQIIPSFVDYCQSVAARE
jgi:hypothetical protein